MAKNSREQGFYKRPLFILAGEDLVTMARDMGIPEKELDEEFFQEVQKGVEAGFDNWYEVLGDAFNAALEQRRERKHNTRRS